MSKPFDATLNRLIDTRPADWVAFLAPRVGLVPGPAEVLDTDLSVTAQADKVFRLTGPPAALIHLELEANPRRGIPADLLRYNVLVGHEHDEPVYTAIVLLRPKANATDLTGVFTRPGLRFEYTVVRVWQESAAALLAGGPATAPLAMLTDEAAADPPGVFDRLVERLRQPDVDAKVRDDVLGSTFVLCGLRHQQSRVADLYRRVSMLLEDSTTYQWILQKGVEKGAAEGAVREARRLLLVMGRKRLGPPPPAADATLQGITDAARLERIAERIFDATGWDDLLATP